MTAAAPEPDKPDTSKHITVQGYHEGRSYAVVIDPQQKDPDYGVVADTTDRDLVAKIASSTGEVHTPLHPTSGAVPVAVDTPEGVLAGLNLLTEVTSVTGTLPDTLTEDTPSPEVVY